MKKIDVIFPAYINAPIGPTGTLRRLLANKEYLLSRGYDLCIFTKELISGNSVETPVDFSKGLSFRSKLKNLFKKSRILSVLFLIRNKKESNKLVCSYLALNRTPDIVVFHESSCCSLYLEKIKKIKKPRVVLFHHSNGKRIEMLLKSYPQLNGSLYFKRQVKRWEQADLMVDANAFISHEGKRNFIIETPSIKESKCFVFHNGIEDKPVIKKIPEKSYKYRLCTTGSVCRRKGQYLIIEALTKISKDKLKDIHVNIYGEGNDLESISQMVINNNLCEHVSMPGYIKNSEIHEKLSECNIYVLMSNNEGLPISIIEAMRAGLGIISTNISGIPEEVDERNGLLIKPDASELTNVLNNLDSYDWDMLGANSRIRFENEFTFSQMIKSYCDMMDALE